MEEKLEKILTQIIEMSVIIARQEENLKEHMRRTEIAEQNIDLLRNDIRPIQTHVHHIEGGVKLIGFIGIITASVLGLIELIK